MHKRGGNRGRVRNQPDDVFFSPPGGDFVARERFFSPQPIDKVGYPAFFEERIPSGMAERHSKPHINRKRGNQSSIVEKGNVEPGYKKKRKETSHSPSPRVASPKNFKFAQLSDEITELCMQFSQGNELLSQKLRLREALLSIFQKSYPETSLYLVGSSCNGFGTNYSDADFCLMVTNNRKVDQRFEAVMILRNLQRSLRTFGFIRKLQVIKAKVPILKFNDAVSGCECDVNINNSVGIRNTHLLRTYSRIDNRVKPILMTVKKWAKSKGINDASQGTLSSYSIALMVIHFLQCACKPAVIPCLQQEYPEYFSENLDLPRLPVFEPADHIPCNRSSNRMSIGELLHEFFRYFGVDFRWDFLTVSVRLGRALPKALRNDWRKAYICIEEPYDQSNTARAVHQPGKFEIIKEEFRQAYDKLEEGTTLDNLLR